MTSERTDGGLLMVIDVGNTHTVIGLFDGDKLVKHWRVVHRARAHRRRVRHAHVEPVQRRRAWNGSARSRRRGVVRGAADDSAWSRSSAASYFHVEPLVVGPGMKTGMPILYDNPREVGADRIVNAVAAYERIETHLHRRRLRHRNDLRLRHRRRASTWAGSSCRASASRSMRSTNARRSCRASRSRGRRGSSGAIPCHAIQAGIVYGYVEMVDGLVRHIEREENVQARVLATGGLAPLIAAESARSRRSTSSLTLEGLRIIYSRNVRFVRRTDGGYRSCRRIRNDSDCGPGRRRQDVDRRRSGVRRRRQHPTRARRRRDVAVRHRAGGDAPAEHDHQLGPHAAVEQARGRPSSTRPAQGNFVARHGLHDARRRPPRCLVLDAATALRAETVKVWGWAERTWAAGASAFVNRLDRPDLDIDGCSRRWRELLDARATLVQLPIGTGEAFAGIIDLLTRQGLLASSETAGSSRFRTSRRPGGPRRGATAALMEARRRASDELLEKYLEAGELADEEIVAAPARGHRRGVRLLPVLCGSAASNIGIPQLLDAIVELLPSPVERAGAEARRDGRRRDRASSRTPAAPFVGASCSRPSSTRTPGSSRCCGCCRARISERHGSSSTRTRARRSASAIC